MSDEGSESTQQEHEPETVGAILRAAREERRLDRQEVADQLHLRPSIIQAIEESDYQSLPGELFLKGYVRSYARLTDQDADELVSRLDIEMVPLRPDEQKRQLSPTEIIRQKKERRRRIGALLIALVTAAIVGWVAVQHGPWVASQTAELIEGDNSTGASEEKSAPTDLEASDAADNASGTDIDTDTGVDGESAARATGASITSESVPLVDAPDADIEDATPASDIETVEPILTAEVVSLWIRFEEACWVEVVNGEDERVVVRLAEAGETIEYEGVGPLEVLLGNVDAVSGIRFRGEPVNLEDYPAGSERTTQFLLGGGDGAG